MSEFDFEAGLAEILQSYGEMNKTLKDAYKESRENLKNPNAQMKYLQALAKAFPEALQQFVTNDREHFQDMNRRLLMPGMTDENIASVIALIVDRVSRYAGTIEDRQKILNLMQYIFTRK